MSSLSILAETRIGRAFTRNIFSSDAIHIEFGNLALNLTHNEFFQFKSLVDSIDEKYCEEYFASSLWRRKMQIQLRPTRSMIALDHTELEELRRLLHIAAISLARNAPNKGQAQAANAYYHVVSLN